MTTILKTGVDNFFVNVDASVSMKYDPAFNEYFLYTTKSSDTKVKIPIDQIVIQKGGQISFNYDNHKYIIDDGYRNTLVVAGYLILASNGTDLDNKSGYSRTDFLNLFSKKELYEYMDLIEASFLTNSISVKMLRSDYEITLEISAINKMIDQNIRRKMHNLPMYPTHSDMNKDTSLYFKIYAKKTDKRKTSLSLESIKSLSIEMLDDIINDIDLAPIKKLIGDVRIMHDLCMIKRTILKWEDNL